MAEHVTTLTHSYISGHEEYTCPLCGFKVVLDWDTEKFSVLVDTPLEVVHVARRDGYTFYISEASSVNDEDLKYLDVFKEFVESLDFRGLLGD